MTRSRILSAILAGASLLAASPVLAGAWTQREGGGQVILGGTFTGSDRTYDGGASTHRTPDYDKAEVNLLMEYGVTDWFTAIVQPQYQSVEIGAPTNADRSGLGYTDVGGRMRLWSNEDSVFSVQAVGRIPGTDDERNAAAVGYTDPEADLRLLYGHAFKSGAWDSFVDAQLAFRPRFDDPPNEIRADFTYGTRPVKNFMILAQSLNVFSDGTARAPFEDGYYSKLQLSGVWDFAEKWSVQLGVVGTVLGDNALQERGVVTGLWYRF